jgi:inner membrane protein
MPTIFTHPVVAIALGRIARTGRRAVVAGALLAVLPDADVYASRLLQLAAPHWVGHRGFTHSLAFALAMAAAVAAFGFRELPRWSGKWWALAAFLFVCAASHGILDALTDGGPGIMFFWPFSLERHFLPWRPLPVSPIGRGFFSQYGLEVLLAELKWIWVPSALLIGAAGLARALRLRLRPRS